jgi:TetR/AcrR family transcriptional repressor of lmrAB and yxaGH operons
VARRSDVRERMIIAGEDLLAQRGYAVTMLDVIERAGAPRGSIYYHFPNGKAELALEVATKLAGDIESFVAAVSARQPDPAQFLQRLIDHHRKRLAGSSFELGCPMMGLVAGGEIDSPELEAAVAQTFTTWTAAIAAALVAKGLPAAASGRLASMTVTGIEGCIVISRAKRSPQPFVDFSRWIPIMVDGVLAR